ncbi:MAG TPA: cache domain-containing protein, partial [Rhodopila sp.]
MNIVSNLRLGMKMTLLLTLSAVAMVAIAIIGSVTLHQRMLDDRMDKLRSMVSATVALAQALEARVGAQEITRQQAIDLFRRNIHAIRFDGGTGYIAVEDVRSGDVLMHGVNPALEGKPTPNDAATGQPISNFVIGAVRSSDEGITSYMFPKPGETQPLPKVTAVAKFRPWDMAIYTGAYTDDLEAAFRSSMLKMGGVG